MSSAPIDEPTPDLMALALQLQMQYEARTTMSERKEKGQFFTPIEVCRFMAGLFSAQFGRNFRLLDPGAGLGSLSAAVCERVSAFRTPRALEIHLFENDPSVLPYLGKLMEQCRESLEMKGHSLKYEIHEKDFILDAAASLFGEPSLFRMDENLGQFDGVIMNPPYFKLNKESDYSRVMDAVVYGQPNIYAFFLAAGAEMLRPRGEIVAITPRSFCNGLYFRDFRKWFFERISLEHIHLFESRTEAFKEVLQESMITLGRRAKQSPDVTVSTSHGNNSRVSNRRNIQASAVLDRASGGLVVRIPSNQVDSDIVEFVESWPHRFIEVGLRVSTGPVVAFRARKFLLTHLDGNSTAPLLSVHNVKPFRTEWPNYAKKHPAAFKVCAESLRHLLPTLNYVLLRRFSAKEERRRLTASWLFHSQYPGPYVALENHLNYIYHADRELTLAETYGLVALFNSALLDRYFRTVSGNTQVNATELRAMKFPDLRTVTRIGKQVAAFSEGDHARIEQIVLRELGVGSALKGELASDTLF